MKTQFLKLTAVRRFCKERGKRLTPDFIAVLETHVRHKLGAACGVHNGGKKKMDAAVAAFVGLTK